MKHTLGILTLLLLAALPLRAQEVQLPLDSVGTVWTMEAELAARLGLFTAATPGFQTARLFQRPDSSFVLEVEYEQAGRRLRDRRDLTREEVETLRRGVSAVLAAQKIHPALDQSGRARLVSGIAALSVGFYSWAVPLGPQIESDRAAVLTGLLIGATGSLVPLLTSRDVSIPEGTARMTMYGGTRGIAYGFLLHEALTGGEGDDNTALLSSVAGSLAGLGLGYEVGNNSHFSPGRATAIGMYGDAGLAGGLGLSLLVRPPDGFDDNPQPGDVYDGEPDDSRRGRAAWRALINLAGGGAGLYAGHVLSGRQSYSVGDGYVLRELGLLTGVLAPIAITDLADAEIDVYGALSAVGVTAGMLAGHRLTRDVDFSPAQGAMVGLAELGGALAGAGVAYLTVPEEKTDDRNISAYYTTMGTVGAAVGFYLGYRAFRDAAPLPRERISWNLDLSPAGMAGLALKDRLDLPARTPLPLATLRVTF